jgi:hypothetical protein
MEIRKQNKEKEIPMNKKEKLTKKDQQLLREVNQLITNETGYSSESTSLHNLCAHLISIRPKADNAFRERLQDSLILRLENKQEQKKIRIEHKKRQHTWLFLTRPIWQTALIVLVILALLAAGLFAIYPPARTFARDVLDVVKGRVDQVIVTVFENGTIKEEKTISSDREEALTFEEAQAQVSFTIRLPAYLPEGYTELDYEVYPGVDEMVTILVNKISDTTNETSVFFELHESLQDQLYAGGEILEEVLINGKPAVWAGDVGTVYDDSGNPASLKAIKLYWEDGGIYFTLRSYSLSQSEMLAIARSIE